MPFRQPDHERKIATQTPAALLQHFCEQLLFEIPAEILAGGNVMGWPGDGLQIQALLIELAIPRVKLGQIDGTPVSRLGGQQ